jgi:hypothetical protein
MSFSLRDVAIVAPFQLSTMSMFSVMGFVKDFPEHSDIVAFPVAGMIVGAAIIGGAWIKAVHDNRKLQPIKVGS